MTGLCSRDEVDPHRFTGKSFARRKAFPTSPDDYIILIDGLVAGRIMQKTSAGQRVVWFWNMTAAYYPIKALHYGEEETFEAATEAFKKMFWQWYAWAMKQAGPATWYGADK